MYQYIFLFLAVFIIGLVACEQQPYSQGKVLYERQCARCHGADGKGFEKLYPPLAQADFLVNHQEELACIIWNGLQGKIVVNGQEYEQVMMGNRNLNSIEITNIINYINNDWGNETDYVTLKTVEAALNECQ